MGTRFHAKRFDDSTQLKLAIFRKYIREWVPVFLSEPRHGRGPNYGSVNIFDSFAGPGRDPEGNPGSPRIIQEELRTYCDTQSDLKSDRVAVRLYFNDKGQANIDLLAPRLRENECPKDCCTTEVTCMPFADAFACQLSRMQDRQSANLVIMDQCGIKEVTPSVVSTLAQCGTTDILFFVSSSIVHRFSSEPAVRKYFQTFGEKPEDSPYKSIHRQVCQYFRSEIVERTAYYLSPFSIKKENGNIYGVMFGSGSLLGLQKFLKVCWDLDEMTGEANYDIDDDRIDRSRPALFAEMDSPRKLDAFHADLDEWLLSADPGNPMTNKDVYRFSLENGFLPQHAAEHLKNLQEGGKLEATNVKTGKQTKKGNYYLTWKRYDKDDVRATFRLKERGR